MNHIEIIEMVVEAREDAPEAMKDAVLLCARIWHRVRLLVDSL